MTNKNKKLCSFCGGELVIDDGREFCNGACYDLYYDDACDKDEMREKIRYKMCLELGRRQLKSEDMLFISQKAKEEGNKMLKDCETDCFSNISCIKCCELVALYRKLIKE